MTYRFDILYSGQYPTHMRSLLIMLASTLHAVSYAQPVLNLTNLQPVVGSTYTFSDAAYQAQGAAGANVTWNFGSLVPTGTPVSFTYVNPTTAEGAINYPGANSAWRSGTGAQAVVNYQSYSASSMQELGTWLGFGYSVFTDPLQQLSFPLTYNTSWSDDYSGTVQLFGTSTISGSLTSTVDAYGTLILPTGTFTNVLRLRTTRSETTTFSGLATTVESQVYYFLKAGFANPLLEVRTTTTTAPGSPPEVEQALRYQSAGNTDIEGTTATSISVAPTITSDLVRVTSPEPFGQDLRVQVIDASGRIIVAPVSVATASVQVDLTLAVPGRYTILLQRPDGRRSTATVIRE